MPERFLKRLAAMAKNAAIGNSGGHISDQQLLLAADGELSPAEAARVQAHLEACWACRARRLTLDRTIAKFVSAHAHGLKVDWPSIDGPRALLRSRLVQVPKRISV